MTAPNAPFAARGRARDLGNAPSHARAEPLLTANRGSSSEEVIR
jgi:hypothetical protein